MVNRTPTVTYHRNGRPLRVATYNVHKCQGLDRRILPERIAEVIGELDADVIALQEVVAEPGVDPKFDQLRSVVQALHGYTSCFGENCRLKSGAPYGNAILSRLPLVGNQNYYLPLTRREQRGCLRADLKMGDGHILHVFNVHMGTGFMERRRQAPKLLSNEILRHAGLSGPRIVLGDFNEWTRGLTTQLMKQHFQSADLRAFTQRKRTYPGVLPLLHLDHVYFDAALQLENFSIHRSRTALVASDHLPLVASFQIDDSMMMS
jgi:endonuclease/exonuclease/phosphatase family metal-dependent hydrolase